MERMKRQRAACALGALIFFGAGLSVFIIAANEQSVLSSGQPAADAVTLHNLAARASADNKHIELSDFYFGKQYVYAAKLTQFQDVYVPVFARGQPEDGPHLQLLVWIRNDRNSNQRLIQSYQDLDQFVADFNQNPRSLAGVLVKPMDRVRKLTVDEYPGTNAAVLQVLWARDFPDEGSVEVWWAVMGICLVVAVACLVAFRRSGKSIPRAQSYGMRR